MSNQRYERVNAHDEEDEDETEHFPELSPSGNPHPTSPPPSFHSRTPSPSSRRLLSQDPLNHHEEADQTLADAFDEDSDDDDSGDDRQRLMRGTAAPTQTQADGSGSNSSSSRDQSNENERQRQPSIQRRVTMLPAFTAAAPTTGRVVGGGSSTRDGVFANLAAKPERGEKNEDLPPSYEAAAADATPPYWETTIMAPGMSSDEVYIDGLPVGSVFSFVWNGMISMSFQIVGFLLTYLLHTTHAAKNGSRAGLGLTLVQYGFYMKGGADGGSSVGPSDQYAPPSDPNSHSFDPNAVENGAGTGTETDGTTGNDTMSAITSNEWISYILMIVGWFILIRAVSDFLRARRHEQLVLQSPDRGLPVPIIAEGERAETAV